MVNQWSPNHPGCTKAQFYTVALARFARLLCGIVMLVCAMLLPSTYAKWVAITGFTAIALLTTAYHLLLWRARRRAACQIEWRASAPVPAASIDRDRSQSGAAR